MALLSARIFSVLKEMETRIHLLVYAPMSICSLFLIWHCYLYSILTFFLYITLHFWMQLFGVAYLGPFGHFLHLILDKIFKGKKDNKTVAKKVELSSFSSLLFCKIIYIFSMLELLNPSPFSSYSQSSVFKILSSNVTLL